MSVKIDIQRPSIIESKLGYQYRKEELLGLLTGPDMEKDIYGSCAIANLYSGKWIEDSRKYLQKVAQ